MTLVAILGRDKPPRTVPLDGTSDRPAELLSHEMRRWLSPVERCGQALERVVSEEEEPRAVPVVRAGLGDDIDDARARSSYFGSEPVRGDLELGHTVFGEIRQRSAHDFVIDVAAVHAYVPAAAEGTSRGDLQ